VVNQLAMELTDSYGIISFIAIKISSDSNFYPHTSRSIDLFILEAVLKISIPMQLPHLVYKYQ